MSVWQSPGELVRAYPGGRLALACEGLPHGLQPTLDQLGGAECEAGPEGGQETRQAIVNNAQVLNLEQEVNHICDCTK